MSRQRSLTCCAGRVKLPYEKNALLRQSGSRMPFAFCAVGMALLFHVGHIVGVGSKEKVVGINAARIITAWTVVADAQTVWDDASMQLPGDPVGKPWLLAHAYSPVTANVARTDPEPTRFRLDDPAPELDFYRDYAALIAAEGGAELASIAANLARFNEKAFAAMLTGHGYFGRFALHVEPHFGVPRDRVHQHRGPTLSIADSA